MFINLRDREKHQCEREKHGLAVNPRFLNQGLYHIIGVFLDRELNLQRFGAWDSTPTN